MAAGEFAQSALDNLKRLGEEGRRKGKEGRKEGRKGSFMHSGLMRTELNKVVASRFT